MTFKSFHFAVAAMLIAVPTVAMAKDAAHFSHQGVSYEYTTEITSGERVIRGTALAGKVPFELHVRNNTVTGTFNHEPVEFTQTEARSMGILVASN